MKRWDPAIAYLGSGEYAPDMEESAGRQKQSTPGVARGVHRRYALGSLGLHAAMARVGWHRWARRQARRRWMRERMARRTA